MKPIEEQLWEFIDGTCNADEKKAMEKLLQADPAINLLHQEFLSISKSLKSMELEEPSLRFTQNVMDRVALEPSPKPLVTKVDKRIINGIGGFFIITLSVLVIFSFTQLNWSAVNFNFDFSLPQIDFTKYFGSAFTLGSVFVFSVLSLFSMDRYLQYRRHHNHSN
ncbi:MAG: hypothetical protein LH473_07960 [Chitinophagales bacterium]|nr:hypothetical protein [Chitinophagales bacterium]